MFFFSHGHPLTWFLFSMCHVSSCFIISWRDPRLSQPPRWGWTLRSLPTFCGPSESNPWPLICDQDLFLLHLFAPNNGYCWWKKHEKTTSQSQKVFLLMSCHAADVFRCEYLKFTPFYTTKARGFQTLFACLNEELPPHLKETRSTGMFRRIRWGRNFHRNCILNRLIIHIHSESFRYMSSILYFIYFI